MQPRTKIHPYPAPAFLSVSGEPDQLILNHGDSILAIYRSVGSSFMWSLAHLPSGLLISDSLITLPAAGRLADRVAVALDGMSTPPTPSEIFAMLQPLLRRIAQDGVA